MAAPVPQESLSETLTADEYWPGRPANWPMLTVRSVPGATERIREQLLSAAANGLAVEQVIDPGSPQRLLSPPGGRILRVLFDRLMTGSRPEQRRVVPMDADAFDAHAVQLMDDPTFGIGEAPAFTVGAPFQHGYYTMRHGVVREPWYFVPTSVKGTLLGLPGSAAAEAGKYGVGRNEAFTIDRINLGQVHRMGFEHDSSTQHIGQAVAAAVLAPMAAA
jgi:hypothetical protein